MDVLASDENPQVEGGVDAPAIPDGGLPEACPGSSDYQTDTANCGGCAHKCGAGTCTAGLCEATTYIDGLTSPSGLAVDAVGDVFVGNDRSCSDGQVLECSFGHTCGGTAGVVISGLTCQVPMTNPLIAVTPGIAVAVNDTNVYWAGSGTPIQIGYRSLGPGTAGSIPGPPLSAAHVVALAVDNQDAYVALNGGLAYYSPLMGTTDWTSISSTNPTFNTNEQVAAIAIQGSSRTLYGVNAADSMNSPSSGSVWLAETGGKTTPGPGAQALPTSIAVTSTDVFWGSSNGVQRANLSLAKPGMIASATGVQGVVADTFDTVYWTEQAGNVVMQRANGDVVTLATKQTNPAAIAIDGNHVYWVTNTAVVGTWR